MADKFDMLHQKHIEFIEQQQIFFVASAGCEGLINLSPKGMDTLKIIDSSKLVWLNYIGSGNETAAHINQNSRLTIMFCSFEKKPLILKVFGRAEEVRSTHSDFSKYSNHFNNIRGARQIFVVEIDSVLTSCGYGVPLYEFKSQRDTLTKWLDNKSNDELQEYQQKNNTISLDGVKIDIS